MTGRPGNARAPAVYRVAPLPPPGPDPDADPGTRPPRLALLEAALVLADEPLAARQLAAAVGVADGDIRPLIDQLQALYEMDQTAFLIHELAGGFQLLTRPVYHPWLTRLRRSGHDLRLTPANLETLAVVAYKQPVTRADVEAVRGVAATEALRVLMEKGLVRPAGRQASLGRPQLYATTKTFLQAFGLNTLADLPAAGVLPAPAAPSAPSGPGRVPAGAA